MAESADRPAVSIGELHADDGGIADFYRRIPSPDFHASELVRRESRAAGAK
jgi:hypothetical protein